MQEIVDLFRTYNKYDSMTDNQLRLYLMPSISLGQYKKFYDEIRNHVPDRYRFG